jgi:hypothetical protein
VGEDDDGVAFSAFFDEGDESAFAQLVAQAQGVAAVETEPDDAPRARGQRPRRGADPAPKPAPPRRQGDPAPPRTSTPSTPTTGSPAAGTPTTGTGTGGDGGGTTPVTPVVPVAPARPVAPVIDTVSTVVGGTLDTTTHVVTGVASTVDAVTAPLLSPPSAAPDQPRRAPVSTLVQGLLAPLAPAAPTP